VDEIYAAALEAGAIGGKLIGAGGGGFILLFARPADHERIRERLRGLVHVPFRFERGGSRIIFFDPGEDYGAQARLRLTKSQDTFREDTATLVRASNGASSDPS
jgi:D-glycero-alpha-D-manno-heptose-7-phosphate kinase